MIQNKDILRTCKEAITELYRKNLEIELAAIRTDSSGMNAPQWMDVSEEDLTSVPEGSDVNPAVLIIDPEIGILYYLLSFDKKTKTRKQIKRALGIRSQLTAERNYIGSPTGDCDKNGSWRIILHWLVNEPDQKTWIDGIVSIRSETGFSEELSFDVTFIDDSSAPRFSEMDFPHLLLTVRSILKKKKIEEIETWMSADDKVKTAMTNFEKGFSKPEQQDYAREVIQSMHKYNPSKEFMNKEENRPNKTYGINDIRIKSFRNISDIHLNFNSKPVAVSIIHGPNGTGKSSICEAMSFALFGSSYRYRMFSDKTFEKDISAVNRDKEYIKYLSPLKVGSTPEVSLNGQPLEAIRPVDKAETAAKANLEMSGTILTQVASLEFTNMSSSELGARILLGYSGLAEHVEEFTDSRMIQANKKRQDFLKENDLSSAITKIDTAYERIVKKEIDKSLPVFPDVFVSWLETAEKSIGEIRQSNLSASWHTWGDNENRGDIAKSIAYAYPDKDRMINNITSYLNLYNDLVLRSKELVKNAEIIIEPVRKEIDNSISQLTIWGEWLEKRKQAPANSAQAENKTFSERLSSLQKEQARILEEGRNIRTHYDHLTQVDAFIRETWSKSHPDDCPTCGARHEEHGGILKVVQSLKAKTEAERDKKLGEYSQLKSDIESIQKEMSLSGQLQCPLNNEDQTRLTVAFQWFVPSNTSIADWIGIKEQREILLDDIKRVCRIPSIPNKAQAESEADLVTQKIIDTFTEAERTFESPDNWKPVKDRLKKTLGSIVQDHLPNTLEKLWYEIAFYMTSAPWIYPDKPGIKAEIKKGEKSSSIQVNGRLARYILNHSEMHLLGLAWFFTRYLTYGRFHHPCIIMDDPALELDQTSFRELCRFWETIIRLHKIYGIPLKLIIMLNQESRAVEAARATNGILTILGWGIEHNMPVTNIDVVGEGFYSPFPNFLYKGTQKGGDSWDVHS